MTLENVLILGASENPERYAFKAMEMLESYGHKTVLVNPRFKNIGKRECFSTISEAKASNLSIDTVTLYVNPQILVKSVDEIISLAPKRIIFNPGTEDLDIMKKFEDKKIEVIEGCTLVMLRTNQF